MINFCMFIIVLYREFWSCPWLWHGHCMFNRFCVFSQIFRHRNTAHWTRLKSKILQGNSQTILIKSCAFYSPSLTNENRRIIVFLLKYPKSRELQNLAKKSVGVLNSCCRISSTTKSMLVLTSFYVDPFLSVLKNWTVCFL